MKSFPVRGLAANALLCLAAFLFFARLSPAAPFVVKVADHDGSILIPGDSVKLGCEGWIDALAFGQALGNPGETFVGATGFTFHKAIDSASPHLMKAAALGTILPAVIFKIAGGEGDPVVVELNHVMVTGHRLGSGCFHPLGAAESGRPIEEITLTWSQVVLHYRTAAEETSGGFVAHESTADPRFDDDADGLANDRDVDDDNDAMADRYESAHGLNPFADDAGGDADRDSRSNLDEAVADTRANDGSDFFKIDSLTYRTTAAGPEAVVTLTVKPGRRYKLLATADLSLPRASWMVADEFEVTADEVAGPTEIILKGPLVANAARLFFAAEVDLAGAEER